MDVIIIHGAYGNPQENWIPWLKRELEGLGCDVHVPRFPTPEGQTLENWMRVYKQYEKYVDEDTIFVGHSISCAFVLSVLERVLKPVKAAFLVSGFLCSLENPDFDEINKTFVIKPFMWDVIKSNCSRFYVFHSDNDPYVPLEKGDDIAKNLGVDLIMVPGAGHFNESAGYDKFELLLDKIKENL